MFLKINAHAISECAATGSVGVSPAACRSVFIIKTLNNINFLCISEYIYYFCSCICLQKPRKGLAGGCSLYEKGVYQALCLLLFVISQITYNCKRTETTVNVHGWYIIASRGLPYPYMAFHVKEQYIPIAWASALSVSTIRAMREPRTVGWMTGKIPTLSFYNSLITNRKHQGNWDIAYYIIERDVCC